MRYDRGVIPVVALLALTAVAFLPVLWNGFLRYDDALYVTANERVLEGLSPSGFAWAFTVFHGANWHPLTWLSHMLDVSLFGTWAPGHHLVNLLIHLLNAALLLTTLRAATGREWPSLLVAALFALHPQHVESVAWLAERKDLLSTSFALLAIRSHILFAEMPTAVGMARTTAFLALGLMSKPMVVTVPFLLMLLDAWPLRRIRFFADVSADDSTRSLSFTRLVVEKAPLFLLSAASCVVTVLAQKAGKTVAQEGVLSLGARLGNAVVAVAAYLAKTVWPVGLAAAYPHPIGYHPASTVVASVALIVMLSVAAVATLRRRPYIAVGWCWFLGMLVPVLGFIQVGSQARADRYTYLPLVGVFIAVAFLIDEILRDRPGRWRKGVSWCAAVLLVLLASMTFRQAGFWKSDETLMRHADAVVERNWLARLWLAEALAAEGRDEEAVEEFRRGLALKPDSAESLRAMGMALRRLGRFGEAAEALSRSAMFRPDAAVLDELGVTWSEAGRPADGIKAFKMALSLKPELASALNNLGFALWTSGGKGEEVEALFRKALKSDPAFLPAHINLARYLASVGRREEAVAFLVDASRRLPELREEIDAMKAGSMIRGDIDQVSVDVDDRARR